MHNVRVNRLYTHIHLYRYRWNGKSAFSNNRNLLQEEKLYFDKKAEERQNRGQLENILRDNETDLNANNDLMETQRNVNIKAK